ncbi:MAG TPA: AAA family ATPase [Anaerolineae bacterium]|nr:AAA family ATPase [Anaerolineae bacterium]
MAEENRPVACAHVTRHGLLVDEVVSALQKEIRRGHTESAALLAYEMVTTGAVLEAQLWQRLQVISVEDVGLGQPEAPVLVRALFEMHLELEPGAGDRALMALHAVRFLCCCAKDRGSDELLSWLKLAVEADGLRPVIPDYALDMHTAAGRARGRGKRHFLEEGAIVSPELAGRDETYRRRLLERLEDET